MVAGVIARELGLELYRVDLSRVVSKWVGETEKNLAEVFAAAEDGQVAILCDEDMRLRLWATHVTPQTPTVGDFDFGELARRFPLSGGYIRNCVVRAAVLAAHEDRPLGQAHLLRAIQLEYRELGRLSTSSRME